MAYSSNTSKPAASSAPAAKKPVRSSGGLRGLLSLVVILVILGGGVYALSSAGVLNNTSLTLKSDWQAVFLSNGQVYFGKIVAADQQTITLQQIYYLQVVNQPLQRSATPEEQPAEGQTEQRLTLIKLGNEIHGPLDEMILNRDHIVIIEDLKGNSRVVQAIGEYQASQQAQ